MKRSLPLVVILLMLGTLKGQSSSSDPIDVIGLKEALSKIERVQLAENLLFIFEPIEAAVPSLSPSQKEWLAEERKAGIDVAESSQRARALNFYQSQEFTIEYTKTRLSSLVAYLRLLIGPRVAKGVIGTRERVFLWSDVAYILIEQDFDDYLTRLRKQGFFDDLGSYGVYGRHILGSIVMPYLAQEQFPE